MVLPRPPLPRRGARLRPDCRFSRARPRPRGLETGHRALTQRLPRIRALRLQGALSARLSASGRTLSNTRAFMAGTSGSRVTKSICRARAPRGRLRSAADADLGRPVRVRTVVAGLPEYTGPGGWARPEWTTGGDPGRFLNL